MSHRVWMVRRGFNPVEHQVAVAAGQQIELHPEWVPLPSVQVEAAPPEEAALCPAPEQPPQMPPNVNQADGQTPPEESFPQKAVSQETKPEPVVPPPTALELAWKQVENAFQVWEAAEKKYRETLSPVEKKVSEWDFGGALEQAQQIQFEEAELASRLAIRQKELEWMAELKGRIVQRLGALQQPLRKTDLGIRGVGGHVVGADDKGIRCQLMTGSMEEVSWSELGPQGVGKLAALVVDRGKGEDYLKAAVLVGSLGEATAAGQYLQQAAKLGIDVKPHVADVGYGLVGEAIMRLREKKYSAAGVILQRVESEPALESWRLSQREMLLGLRKVIEAGQREQEAEKLYAEAKKLFEAEEFFDVRDIVQKLAQDYGDTSPVLDPNRDPTFAKLSEATTNLGRRIIVRQDGKGDFTSIQAAIDAAPVDSLIEIQGSGPYREKLVIAKKLEISGARGEWVVLLSETVSGGRPPVPEGPCIDVRCTGVRIRRIAVINCDMTTRTNYCVAIRAPADFRYLISWSNNPHIGIGGSSPGVTVIRDSLFYCVMDTNNWSAVFHNCVLLFGLGLVNKSEITNSLVFRSLNLTYADHMVKDSIVFECGIHPDAPLPSIQNCLFLKPGVPGVSKNSFHGNPMFRDPANMDYRLLPGSPCIGKASDGGDIGVRWTPEMLEMIQVVLELLRRGMIKF